MVARNKVPHPNEFTPLAAFVVAAVLSLAVGAVVLTVLFRDAIARPVDPQEVRRAPTVAEYREEASRVLTPFLAQAAKMTEADILQADRIVIDLVEKTQERLLSMTVPAEERDAHLHFVLLLDQWKRALDGSPVDANVVGERTAEVVAEHPWLLPDDGTTP